MKKEKDNNILLIITIVIVILIFIGSFGQVNIAIEKEEKPSNTNESYLNSLQKEYQKLKALIKQKEALNIRLNKKFKRIYFGVRLGLTLVYLGYNALLFFIFKITALGDLLNWNQLAIIIISIFSFIAFGTFANVKEYIHNLKMKLESSVYKKHVNLNDELIIHKQKAIKLTTTINKVQLKLSTQNNYENALLEEKMLERK